MNAIMLNIIGLALIASASSYAVLAWLARARTWQVTNPLPRPGVTVLKPLCGADLRLEENLAALCMQDYPAFQILCGVRDNQDPAIAIVERLRQRYPACDLQLIADPRVHGSNLKVSNLMNLEAHIRHDWLVLADSDIAVERDYLTRVTAPLADERVGTVTCLYRGRPRGGVVSLLATLFIDTWFGPSVRVASAFGADGFGFGSTIALRRISLVAIGGFTALRNRLADDYWLAALVQQTGLKGVLSEVVVTTEVSESEMRGVWQREVRWMRTIRSLNRPGFSLSFVTCTVPVLVIGLSLSTGREALALAVIGLVARLALHARALRANPNLPLASIWLIPVRDCLLLLEWFVALGGSSVQWRDRPIALHEPVAEHLASDGPDS